MSDRSAAAIILFALGIFPIAAWYMFLTVTIPSGETWVFNLEYILDQKNGLRLLFFVSCVFGVLSLIAGVTYLTKASKTKTGLLMLLAFCIIQAILAVIFTGITTSVLYMLSVVVSYIVFKNPNNTFNFAHEKHGPDAKKDSRPLT